jgi:type I restriction enzyme S subunit
VVRADRGVVVSEFIGARLSSIASELEDLASGTTNQIELSRQAISALRVDLPPLAEQQRIVDLVGSIDAYITALDDQITATRTARGALLSELLSSPGADWQTTTLGHAFEIRMGRQRSPKNATGPNMVRYLRAANVKDGELLLGDVKKMNFSPDEQATFGLEPGDVLVTEGCGSRAEVGASARWASEIDGMVCFQNTLLRMRRVRGVTSSGFAEVIARYFYSSGKWADEASGTSIFHIGAKRAEAILIDLPPLAEQRSIVDLAGSFDDQVAALEAQVGAVRGLRSGVLSELLSGERLLDESYDVVVGL